jgi:ferric-dicitrate binding protein FerR (iron transport regulator)
MHQPQPVQRLWSIAVAASLLLLAGVGGYFLFFAEKQPGTVAVAPNHSLPVVNPQGKVWLRLDDGEMIALDSVSDGRLAHAAGVMKEGSSLSYEDSHTTAPAYHTLVTAAGMQYEVILPDGSKAWLNAASTLRYPTAFTGAERLVQLTGEAFFEVAKDALHPFQVQSGDAVTEVLGTVFNTQAYKEEGHVVTTLLEGSVKITKGANSRRLSPGHQATVSHTGIQVKAADTEAAIGWKNGTFVFRKTPLAAVLRELERWYGINIENKHGVAIHLTATIKRSLALDKVLQLLEDTEDLRFRRNGANIEVLP